MTGAPGDAEVSTEGAIPWYRYRAFRVPLSVLLVGACAFLVFATIDRAPTRDIRDQLVSSMPIFDGSGSNPLFDDVVLTPGLTVSRCVTLDYSDSTGSGTVGFGISDASGGLLPWMTIEVDEGSGGNLGDCTGFVGSEIYSGSVPSAVYDGVSAPPVSTNWDPSTTSQSSFRITISVDYDPVAMGLSATGTLDWAFDAGTATTTTTTTATTTTSLPVTTTVPTTTTSVPVTTTTVPATTTTLPATTTSVPATTTSVPVTTTTTLGGDGTSTTIESTLPVERHRGGQGGRGPGGPGPGGGSSPNPQSGAGPSGGAGNDRSLQDRLAAWGGQVANHSAFPIVLIALLIFFLFLQGRIDRSDPKLMLANLAADPVVEFSEVSADDRAMERGY